MKYPPPTIDPPITQTHQLPNRPNPHMQPIPRLRRNPPSNNRYKPRVLQLRLKSPNPRRHQTLKLAHRKTLPNTTPRPMKESQELVIGTHILTRASRPSLRFEFLGIRPPKLFISVDGPGRNHQGGA
ncbi:MAG: hypothetical protein Q9226_009137 [Calogaya cf. arnoldii]